MWPDWAHFDIVCHYNEFGRNYVKNVRWLFVTPLFKQCNLTETSWRKNLRKIEVDKMVPEQNSTLTTESAWKIAPCRQASANTNINALFRTRNKCSHSSGLQKCIFLHYWKNQEFITKNHKQHNWSNLRWCPRTCLVMTSSWRHWYLSHQ